MTYIDKRLKKTHETKRHLDDYTEELAQACAEASGTEKSTWMRAVIQKYLEEQGYSIPCERKIHLKRAG